MAPGTRISAFAVFVVVAALAGCQAVAEASDSTPLTAVSIGDNVSPVIAARIIASISNVSQVTQFLGVVDPEKGLEWGNT